MGRLRLAPSRATRTSSRTIAILAHLAHRRVRIGRSETSGTTTWHNNPITEILRTRGTVAFELVEQRLHGAAFSVSLALEDVERGHSAGAGNRVAGIG